MLNSANDNFRRLIDEVFENAAGGMLRPVSTVSRSQQWSPVLESAWTDNALRIRAIVPGVLSGDLKVTLNNNQLVLEGERKLPEGWQKDAWTQLAYGKFQTAVTLPTGLDADKLECRLHDGVLDISVPVSEARRPRQVQVQTGAPENNQARTITA
ncbi:MAG TPA: Hsp20 family protein [Bryobacteraceae bacterium]|nr:Hsp20 family protein [Bryobacteraceae bacterium]